MYFGVVTLFPAMLDAVTQQGVTGKAVQSGLVQVDVSNPRDFATDKYRTVDDRPYGGGPGMLMKVEPLEAALQHAKRSAPTGVKTVYLSPQGRPIKQELLAQTALSEGVILICGRYEGVDERFIQTHVDEEWSLGDFVLSGGEIAAMAVIDGVSRLVPGVLGHEGSAEQDSFADGLLDCPHYTRPEHYQGQSVPEVLLSGNHEYIRQWRLKQAMWRTKQRRPDLLQSRVLSAEEKDLLKQIDSEESR